MTEPDPVEVGIATAAAAGGVAVVTLRGSGIVARLARLGVDGTWCAPRPAASSDASSSGGERPRGPRLVRLKDGDEELDEALIVGRGSRGTDYVELHLHGSPPLVERVVAILRGFPPGGDCGPVVPRCLRERARAMLGEAASELGARILLDQAEGAWDRELEVLEVLEPDQLRARLRTLSERARVARFLLRPTTVVLVGAVNAGKSTLFNLLVGSERTLVSAEEGTTRDAIAEEAQLGPWPLVWVDTAGRRELGEGEEHDVERAGQALGRDARGEGDWALELARAAPRPGVGRDVAAGSRLWTCCDELDADSAVWPRPGVSVREQPAAAVATLRQLFEEHFDLPGKGAPLWEAGAAVPFEGRLQALVDELAAPGGPLGLVESGEPPGPRDLGDAGRAWVELGRARLREFLR